MDITDEEFKKDDSIIELAKKKRQSKKIEYTESEKARMRYESVSSATSLDLSNDTTGDITLSLSKIPKDKEKQGKWIEVPSSQQKQQKVVQARLKAITTAKDILNEPPAESFVKLTKNNSSGILNNVEHSPTTVRMSVSPTDTSLEMARSPQGNLVISHVGPKLSQKQRKKLALNSESLPSRSLDEYLGAKQYSGSPDKPKNPWKVCQMPEASSSPKAAKAMEFNQILADQKKQKDDFSRIMTKPLYLTQVCFSIIQF